MKLWDGILLGQIIQSWPRSWFKLPKIMADMNLSCHLARWPKQWGHTNKLGHDDIITRNTLTSIAPHWLALWCHCPAPESWPNLVWCNTSSANAIVWYHDHVIWPFIQLHMTILIDFSHLLCLPIGCPYMHMHPSLWWDQCVYLANIIGMVEINKNGYNCISQVHSALKHGSMDLFFVQKHEPALKISMCSNASDRPLSWYTNCVDRAILSVVILPSQPCTLHQYPLCPINMQRY